MDEYAHLDREDLLEHISPFHIELYVYLVDLKRLMSSFVKLMYSMEFFREVIHYTLYVINVGVNERLELLCEKVVRESMGPTLTYSPSWFVDNFDPILALMVENLQHLTSDAHLKNYDKDGSYVDDYAYHHSNDLTKSPIVLQKTERYYYIPMFQQHITE
jgi:hypothetical protein